MEVDSTGGGFSLATYENIYVTGSLGPNNLTGSQQVAFTDARANGDISKWKGVIFPKYYGRYGGATAVIYVAVNNQGSQNIRLENTAKHYEALVLQITDSNGFPGTSCTIGIATTNDTGAYEWLTIGPNFSPYSGDQLDISFPEINGLILEPGYPEYFGVACK